MSGVSGLPPLTIDGHHDPVGATEDANGDLSSAEGEGGGKAGVPRQVKGRA